MNARRSVLLVLGVLVVACGPASATPSPAGSAPAGSPSAGPTLAGGPPTVLGSVTAGPVCPVEPSPPDPRCAPRPVADAVIVATNAAGQEVGRTTSGADGTYQLSVGETGQVIVTALPVEGLMRPPEPVQLTLSAPGTVEHLDLEYDTGIR